jgi:hypothetical protein
MHAHDSRVHSADVVAVFENQDDADEALLQLRLSGFRDDHIGYFSWHPTVGLTDLLERHHGFSGSVLGGILGGFLGVGMAMVLNDWYAALTGAHDFLGLAITCSVFMALFIGFMGWWIGASFAARGVEMPILDPAIGPFIMAVSTGDMHDDPNASSARARAWEVLHRNGGHELSPNAMMPHVSAV